jgi:hypothetical protein
MRNQQGHPICGNTTAEVRKLNLEEGIPSSAMLNFGMDRARSRNYQFIPQFTHRTQDFMKIPTDGFSGPLECVFDDPEPCVMANY